MPEPRYSVVRPDRLLLATDGSEDATLAARVAIDLSRRTGARLHVAHAWHHLVKGLATIAEYIAQMVRDRGHQVSLLYGGHGLYEPYPASLAGLVGQDAITLAVGLPLLLASMWLTARGSTSGLLLWTGALFYFAYFYVIGGFNAIFLLYVAIVSTSLYGMLSLLFAIDPVALKACFGARTPTRLVGGFLVGYSLLLLNGR